MKVNPIRHRILTKGVRAEDIRHHGRLSLEDIQDINTDKVYEWVKTDQWKRKDFNAWLKAIRVIE
jgi:hypothetical protein